MKQPTEAEDVAMIVNAINNAESLRRLDRLMKKLNQPERR